MSEVSDRPHDVTADKGIHFCHACGYRGPDAPEVPCPGPIDPDSYAAFSAIRAHMDDLRGELHHVRRIVESRMAEREDEDA